MAHQGRPAEPGPDDEAQRVAIAKAIRTMQDNWAAQVEYLQLQARIARARYEALVKVGFSEADALAMCHRRVDV